MASLLILHKLSKTRAAHPANRKHLPVGAAFAPRSPGGPDMNIFRRLLTTDAPASVLLVRLLAGAVFLSEGVQKFLFPHELGVGRFTKIGIPAPEVIAPFVGVCETVCGLLLILGLLTRPAALVLLVDMLVAIATTKVPILLEKGFWAMAHESRTDWSMLLASLFLLIAGAGAWSLDALLARAQGRRPSEGQGRLDLTGVVPGGEAAW
jgi:uncharacterized membrane protein YphA (DoxX/SURF4 family)